MVSSNYKSKILKEAGLKHTKASTIKENAGNPKLSFQLASSIIGGMLGSGGGPKGIIQGAKKGLTSSDKVINFIAPSNKDNQSSKKALQLADNLITAYDKVGLRGGLIKNKRFL
jgi:hypothetical protein